MNSPQSVIEIFITNIFRVFLDFLDYLDNQALGPKVPAVYDLGLI